MGSRHDIQISLQTRCAYSDPPHFIWQRHFCGNMGIHIYIIIFWKNIQNFSAESQNTHLIGKNTTAQEEVLTPETFLLAMKCWIRTVLKSQSQDNNTWSKQCRWITWIPCPPNIPTSQCWGRDLKFKLRNMSCDDGKGGPICYLFATPLQKYKKLFLYTFLVLTYF